MNEIILVLLAVVPYLRAIRGEFLFDDTKLFHDDSLPQVCPYWKVFWSDPRALTHMLDGWLWTLFHVNHNGKDSTGTRIVQPSWPWHVLSLLFHVGTTLAVWSLIGLFLESDRAWLAAAIFAVHPLQVQAVAYISGRAGVQAAFFSTMGLLHASVGGWHWGMALVSQYLSCKSKPDGILYLIFYGLIIWRS